MLTLLSSSDIERPLAHNAEVKVFCGAAESVARVRLLESDAMAPGTAGWLQIRLREPMPLSRGDRFILRYPSPGRNHRRRCLSLTPIRVAV